MLSFEEHKEVSGMMDAFDEVFTDEVYDKAAYYDIEEDVTTLSTKVTLYDEDGAVLAVVSGIEDYDMAVAYMEEEFDLEEYDSQDADADVQAASTPWGQ